MVQLAKHLRLRLIPNVGGSSIRASPHLSFPPDHAIDPLALHIVTPAQAAVCPLSSKADLDSIVGR